MKLEDVVLEPDTIANQPAASAVAVGTLYCQTDSTPGNNLQRSNGTTWEDFAPSAGGSGNITDTTAFGSEPGGPSTGDLDFYTNSFYVSRYSGAAWIPWGPIFPMTPPVSGDFSWVNQGGASIVTTFGGVYLEAPSGTAGVSIRGRFKSAPSTPYTIVAGFLPAIYELSSTSMNCGVGWSDGTKFATALAFSNTTDQSGIASSKFTTTTAFSADYAVRRVSGLSMVWFKFTDNGTDRIISWSKDGQNFLQIHSVGRTDFLTATQVGFFVNAGQTTAACGMTLLSWKET